MKTPGGKLLELSPRQQDIYNEMRENNIPTPDGKMVTPQWVKDNLPSTPMQPRKKRKSSSKTKRKGKRSK
jgi:hypothetical protein